MIRSNCELQRLRSVAKEPRGMTREWMRGFATINVCYAAAELLAFVWRTVLLPLFDSCP